tara:strand:- start:48 stop:446 length:399 start_codon:yes stop_codon:yes gene_type:complete
MNLINKLKNLGTAKINNIEGNNFGELENSKGYAADPIDNAADTYTNPEVVENRYVKAMPSGMEEANKQISLDKTRKDIIKSTSDNYGLNTNSILSNSKSYRRNNTLTKKAQYTINKNQLKAQALRKKHDEIQ